MELNIKKEFETYDENPLDIPNDFLCDNHPIDKDQKQGNKVSDTLSYFKKEDQYSKNLEVSHLKNFDYFLNPNCSKFSELKIENDFYQPEDKLKYKDVEVHFKDNEDELEYEDGKVHFRDNKDEQKYEDAEVHFKDSDVDESEEKYLVHNDEKQILFRKLQESKVPVLLERLGDEKKIRTRDFENQSLKSTSDLWSGACRSHRSDDPTCTVSSLPSKRNKIRSRFKGRSKFKDVACSKRSYKANKELNPERHLSRRLNSKLLDCASCNDTTFEKHKIFDVKNDTGSVMLKCLDCGYKAKSKHQLKVHMLNHSNVQLFKCFLCSYSTKNKPSFKTHLLTHSHSRLLKCSECKFETKGKSNLKVHLLNHSGLKIRQCSLCEYRTNDPSNFRRHKLTHFPKTDELPSNLFKCSECNFTTYRKDNLKQHIFIHSNIKRFKCSECEFESSRNDSLKNHMASHKNLKLFHCAICKFEANYKNSLRKHILRHHSTPILRHHSTP